MFDFSVLYQGPEPLEDEELDDSSNYKDWSVFPHSWPLGKEELKKKINEILGEKE